MCCHDQGLIVKVLDTTIAEEPSPGPESSNDVTATVAAVVVVMVIIITIIVIIIAVVMSLMIKFYRHKRNGKNLWILRIQF